ncbi:MAG: succinate dehydrogenase/fumarate reductase transmembrane subunit [Bacilli bacterium]
MKLQKALSSSPRSDLIVEMVQMVSGLLLVLFLWTHMLFVGSILLGSNAFNGLAYFMEKYYLLPAAVVFLLLVGGAHVGAVIRRIPSRWAEQKIVWKHAKLIHHVDTWSWLFQSVTGGAILVLVIIHVAVVVYGGIDVIYSAGRIKHGFLIFYAVLLLLAEYHASVGLYRIFVKWGWVKRHKLHWVLGVISVLTVGIGAAVLWIFFTMGVHA